MRESVIRVRDRRTPHQFSVHNRIIDEWYPLIGQPGLALYCLYCRLSSKDEERCYPGYRLISKHMQMGQSTISDYNKLLVWCGLIYIETGDPHKNEPNDYYILDIPQVIPERLAAIRELVEADVARLVAEREVEAQRLVQGGLVEAAAKLRQREPNRFLRTVLKRLNKWRPIQTYWGREKVRPPVAKPGQLSLFGQLDPAPDAEHPAPRVEHPASQAEYPASGAEHLAPDAERPAPSAEHPAPPVGAEQSKTTIQSNNPNQQSITTVEGAADAAVVAANSTLLIASILDWMGFNGRLTAKDKNPSVAVLLAWAYWVRVEGAGLKEKGKNAVGIARAGWRRGDTPGGNFLGLAQRWLALDGAGRREMVEAVDRARYTGRVHLTRDLEDLGVTEPVLVAFAEVWQATGGDVAPVGLLPELDGGVE